MKRSSASTRNVRWILPLLAVALASACAKQEGSELQWARSALARNPDVEIVAADEKASVFTLRDRQTGEVTAVPLQEIAAAPVSQLLRKPLPLAPATPASQPAPADTAPATPAPEPTPQQAAVEPTPIEPPAAAESVATTNDTKPYVIDRVDGQLRVSGPGISVVSAGPAVTTTPQTQGPHAAEPIICEGRRMLHLDNRNLQVEGDAITVRGGCELYITNSNIVASGTGVRVHDGIVHIANSYIEGAASSFEADSQAKVFLRGSTFQGLPRRDQLATVQDQGGNRWR
ncbi:MAG TPA: hypothetical protein PKE27_22285 [Povalibacter sp.]|uniref:hypothetical protein n=1 Tax=Povalibacter sp. TaxID=1962978 RepID=UPI002B83774E|nr:hypothetical protein [Povalibacter sp.]HMN47320.1 hypothetical protein [Povalibacter sp.]